MKQFRLFAVIDDGQAHRRAVAESLPHDVGVGDRVAVVAEADCARLCEFAHLRELLTLALLGNAADGQDAHGSLVPRLSQNVLQCRSSVHRRVGIGHGADGGEAAACRRECAGGYRLLVLEARFAQVAVDVYETGTDDHASGIDDFGMFGWSDVLSDALYNTIFHK